MMADELKVDGVKMKHAQHKLYILARTMEQEQYEKNK